MPGKRNLARENEVRRMDTKKRRAERVIIGYVKTLHPAVYDEGNRYYTYLDKIHPGKKDLTKTTDFRSLLKNKVVITNNLELRIELMDHGTAKTTTTTTTTTPAAETAPAPAPEIMLDPAAETVPAPAPEITLDPAAETVPAPAPEITPLDEETLEQLMADLRQDPDMAAFLDNIDFELDNCPLW